MTTPTLTEAAHDVAAHFTHVANLLAAGEQYAAWQATDAAYLEAARLLNRIKGTP